MKLVTFEMSGNSSYGLWTEAGVVDLGRRLGARFATLHELIAAGGLSAAAEAADAAPDYAHTDVRLDKPLLRWGKCFCVGVNYPDRNAEYKVIRPPKSPQLDYEGEVALVIGKQGRRIPQQRWAEHVLGYTVATRRTA